MHMSNIPDMYLTNSVEAYIGLLSSEDVRARIAEYSFVGNDVARKIGSIANCLIIAGHTDEGMTIAETVPAEIGITDPDAIVSMWHQMKETEPDRVIPELYDAMGIIPPDDEYAESTELSDVAPGRLVDLVELGDRRAVDALRDVVLNATDEDNVRYGTRMAVKVFTADPNTSVDFVCEAAEKARTYVLQHTPDAEPETDDSEDPVRRITRSIAAALSPARSTLERNYAQTDIALRYFAEDRLRVGDVETADRLQALMISPFYSAELSAKRVALGLDTDGKHAEAVMYYFNASDGDQAARDQGIVCDLIRGGYEPVIEEVSAVLLDESVEVDPVEISPDLLVELHNAGKQEAYHRLMELYPFAGSKQWRYPKALEEMGMRDAAGQLRRSRYEDNSSFSNGLEVLRHEFDLDVWRSIQNTVDPDTRGDIVRVVEQRVWALKLLAQYVKKLKGEEK